MDAWDFYAHIQQVCNNKEQPPANPQEYLKQLLTHQPELPPRVRDDGLVLSDFIHTILLRFETASVANYLGDVFLFYKFFTDMLMKAISLHARVRGNPEWQNPPNYINQIDNEIERKFLGGLFPEINQEIANRNKLDFIDWFSDVLDELGDKRYYGEKPLKITQIKEYLRAIYRRDYLVNFRAVMHLNGVYRSPNPARFTSETDLLERYFAEHDITLIIDLRGDQEAQRSPYISDLLKKHQINAIIVDFNEPSSNEILGSGYKKKTHFLKNEVKNVFRAILENPGATLFHCVSGKDRTGVIAALLQKLVGVANPDILAEYQRSGLDTHPDKLQDMLQYVEEKGGINRYLELCGLSRPDQEALIMKIMNTG